jgi:hypothetical protein
MSVARGFTAGLQAGGRGSGISAGLKEVLAGLRQSQQMQTQIGATQMREQGAMARTMVGEGFDPNTGQMMDASSLPPEMSDAGYSLYRGKPYKTRSIIDETPGEKEAMSMAYMDYVYKQLQEIDPAAAAEYRTKMAGKKREMAGELLGIEMPGSDVTAPRGGRGIMGMLGNVGNWVKDQYLGR